MYEHKHIPRVVIAGTHSGCGKTTATCALLQALVNRKLKVGAFKCGPDYIDPMFHSRIIGAKSANIDLFLFGANTMNYLLAKNGADLDVSVIEGVMGFYDGMGVTSSAASTYEVAQVTQSPVVLVVGARGASLSILATIQGFLDFGGDNQIGGVILNQCSASIYPALAAEIERRFSGRVIPLGFLPTIPECSLESRHLGLVTAAEVHGLREKLQILAEQAEKTVDLDRLLEMANAAPEVTFSPDELALPDRREPVRIAVARDNAFCFYYEDSLDMLREMGAELVPFSPLSDRALPQDIHGLYLGGGYPELYAQTLSENVSMLASVRDALGRGLPCIAECGGFMYLTESVGGFPTVGAIPGASFDNGRLTRFGYVRLRANEDCMLCKAGGEIAGHEFHHWDSDDPGSSFTATNTSGKTWGCVHSSDTLYAGYPHFHFCSNLVFASNFYGACLKEKHRND